MLKVGWGLVFFEDIICQFCVIFFDIRKKYYKTLASKKKIVYLWRDFEILLKIKIGGRYETYFFI